MKKVNDYVDGIVLSLEVDADSFVKDKSTIHEVTRNCTKKTLFRAASCDFVDRALIPKSYSMAAV